MKKLLIIIFISISFADDNEEVALLTNINNHYKIQQTIDRSFFLCPNFCDCNINILGSVEIETRLQLAESFYNWTRDIYCDNHNDIQFVYDITVAYINNISEMSYKSIIYSPKLIYISREKNDDCRIKFFAKIWAKYFGLVHCNITSSSKLTSTMQHRQRKHHIRYSSVLCYGDYDKIVYPTDLDRYLLRRLLLLRGILSPISTLNISLLNEDDKVISNNDNWILNFWNRKRKNSKNKVDKLTYNLILILTSIVLTK